MIKIQIDSKELEELTKNISAELFDKVFITTSNEIVASSFSKARTQIKKKWNIDIKQENKEWAFANKSTGKTNKRNGRMQLTRAKINDRYITLDIAGSPLNLSLFEYTWNQEVNSKKTFKSKRKVIKKKNKFEKVNKNKIRIKILKSQTTVLENAFISLMPNGHRGIFQRYHNKSLPILEKRTVTPTSMFEQIDFESILNKEFNEKISARFSHNLNRLTNGFWK